MEDNEVFINNFRPCSNVLSISFNDIETDDCSSLQYEDCNAEDDLEDIGAYLCDLFTLLRKEGKTDSKNAKLGIIENDYLYNHNFDHTSKEIIENRIQNILNLIDDEGKRFGFLAVSHKIPFGHVNYKFNNDVIECLDNDEIKYRYHKLSSENQEKVKKAVKKYDEYYKSIGFYPIYSKSYLGYANYVYGDIGNQLSEISKIVVGDFEKLF